MSNPTIGVHVIIKNESELLPDCLSSIQLADEIIVVDTGSTDNSIQIALDHGAIIIPCPWENDFSIPRNKALMYARSDWILVLDADEKLRSSISSIKELLASSSAEAYTVNIDNYQDDARVNYVRHSPVRLFRNRPEYRFQGRIHEQVEPTIRSRSLLSTTFAADTIVASSIIIDHIGYTSEWMARKDKIARNEAILLLELMDRPEDPFTLYNMGITKCQLGDIQQAFRYMTHSLELTSPGALYRPTLIRDLGKLHLQLHHFSAATELMQSSLERYCNYPDLYYVLGQSLEAQGLLERALEAYYQAVLMGERNSCGYVMESGISTYHAYRKMGDVLLQLKRPEEAARQYHLSLQYSNRYLPALKGLAASFDQLAVTGTEIEELLRNIIHPKNSQDDYLLIEALYFINAYGTLNKIQLTDDTVPLPEIVLLLSSSYMKSKQCMQAEQLLKKLAQTTAVQSTECYELWALCQWNAHGSLQEDLRNQLSVDMQHLYIELDSYLNEGIAEQNQTTQLSPNNQADALHTSSSTSTISNELVLLGQRLLDKAVYYKLTTQCEQIAQLLPDGTLYLAKSMYLKGDLLDAADLLLNLMEQQQLDTEGHYYVSNILLEQGHYGEAAALLEQLRASSEDGEELISIALALCYLKLAENSLMQLLKELSEPTSNPSLIEDLRSIRTTIQTLSYCRAHRSYALEKGVCDNEFNHYPNNFLVHDH